ncbi:isocitrate lyase/phosphoenolpyruvate mutase family protein, partial [Escherichia coli]|nr:isocitrate lyase/phosphoenolpyruvate mutase family protein [Escherichia coli]
DVISAKMFEECGFKAIGTTSAGIAASLGYLDGQSIPLNKMVETIENIAKSVNVPVSADIEAGYGQTVEEDLETVKAVAAAGAIGINLEDGTG